MEQLGQLMTVAMAAKRLSLNQGTLRNWMSSGKIPYVKIRRASRLREADLMAIVSPVAVKVTEPAPPKKSREKRSGQNPELRAIMDRVCSRGSGKEVRQ